MTGPDTRREQYLWSRTAAEPDRLRTHPPGDFLSEQLASDTQRFLDEVRERIRRREGWSARPRRV